MTPPAVGTIGWLDITVPDAEALRTFYSRVVGWNSMAVEMEGYNDHCMMPAGSEAPVAGICHARGSNAGLPPQWLPYITVADIRSSLETSKSLGGKLVGEVRETPMGLFAVIQDPAGAHCALFQAAVPAP
jgi:predicted enzyme related to lactoylglutathione lyase